MGFLLRRCNRAPCCVALVRAPRHIVKYACIARTAVGSIQSTPVCVASSRNPMKYPGWYNLPHNVVSWGRLARIFHKVSTAGAQSGALLRCACSVASTYCQICLRCPHCARLVSTPACAPSLRNPMKYPGSWNVLFFAASNSARAFAALRSVIGFTPSFICLCSSWALSRASASCILG